MIKPMHGKRILLAWSWESSPIPPLDATSQEFKGQADQQGAAGSYGFQQRSLNLIAGS